MGRARATTRFVNLRLLLFVRVPRWETQYHFLKVGLVVKSRTHLANNWGMDAHHI